METRLAALSASAGEIDAAATVVFSGTTGFHDLAAREKTFLEKQFPAAPIRGYGGLVGHGLEAQFPLGLAFAALVAWRRCEGSALRCGAEAPMTQPAKTAIVTTIGHARGEGIAVLSAEV